MRDSTVSGDFEHRRASNNGVGWLLVGSLVALLTGALAFAVLIPRGSGAVGSLLPPAPHRHAAPGTHLAASVAGNTRGLKSRCRYYAYTGGPVVPDRSCTPGALNTAAVADPQHTICQPGYLRRLHGVGVDPRREGRLYVAYGAVGASGLYREDHLVDVQDGGSPSSRLNLWPEPVAEAAPKQAAADRLHDQICAGAISVRAAAAALESDWTRGVKR